VEKGTALDLYNQGIISEETLGLLRGEIDAQLTGREHVINPAVKLPPVELSQPPELPEGDKVSPVPEPGQPVQPG